MKDASLVTARNQPWPSRWWCQPTIALIILSLVLLTRTATSLEPALLDQLRIRDLNQSYIPAPVPGQSREQWIAALKQYREAIRSGKFSAALQTAQTGTPLNRQIYGAPGQHWLPGAFTCHFTFMYDRSFYDPVAGEYQLRAFLDDGEKEFGGYDVILLWQGYPRLGVDPRNQFDFYRDMPGGFAGIRNVVAQAHRRGTKVFVDYNPWDQGTRHESKSDEDSLADLVAATGIDGVFLDTLSGGSPLLHGKLDAVHPGISLCPEGNPSIPGLSLCGGSWAQWVGGDFGAAALDNRKWIEPRHMRWQIDRWNTAHRDEIRRAFFNGSGIVVWENVFGTYNPWSKEDRLMWRRAAGILHQYPEIFSSDNWDPFYPTLQPGTNGAGPVYCHHWSGDGVELFTMLAARGTEHSDPTKSTDCKPLVRIPARQGWAYYDLWHGKPAAAENVDQTMELCAEIEPSSGLVCLAAIRRDQLNAKFRRFLATQLRLSNRLPVPDKRNFRKPDLEPRPPLTNSRSGHGATNGMVFVSGAQVRIYLEHSRRECGCYPDLGTPENQQEKFRWGTPFDGPLVHDFTVDVKAFYIDEAQISNTEFKRFLDETHYRPTHPENFLKHWPGGKMSEALADHPVVYVDLNDARAYAKWAGKRLPTEYEWQLAAQGTDGRRWPWGNDLDRAHPDSRLVNTTGATLPVRALPEGRSPYGCYQMTGNVYEWTESERDDGHTRYAIIRGGSFFEAKGSVWYMDGGPRPCTHHAKFILMWPGLDRCATIGFRCVKDVE